MDHENVHKSYLKRFQCQNLKKVCNNGAENKIIIMRNLLLFNFSKYRVPVALLSRNFFV